MRLVVMPRQDAALVLRQDNIATSAAQTGAGASATGAATSAGSQETSTAPGTDGSSTSPTDGSSQQSPPAAPTSPTDTSGTGQYTPSIPPSSTSVSSTPQPSSSNTSLSSAGSSTYQPPSSSSPSDTVSSTSASSSPPTSSPPTSSSPRPASSTTSTSSSSSMTTTAPPSSSSSASGRHSTIGTRTVFETSNGQVITSLEPIVTTLGESDSGGMSPGANKGIIAGSVVGVAALLILALAMVVFYRRHRHKKLDFFKRKQPKPRDMLLEGEDLDDLNMGPPMASYRDYPGSMVSHSASPSLTGHYSLSHGRDVTNGSITGLPMDPHASYSRVNVSGGMPSPHLMGMRTSEAGSLFQEQVWPPPRTPFVDPLVSTEDLTHIVDDVMGPRAGELSHPPTSFRVESRLRGGNESISSLESAPDMPAGARHVRSSLQTTLPPPASPQTPTWRTPLFVTNMGNDVQSVCSQQSPQLGASRRLSGPHQALSTEGEPMGEAL